MRPLTVFLAYPAGVESGLLQVVSEALREFKGSIVKDWKLFPVAESIPDNIYRAIEQSSIVVAILQDKNGTTNLNVVYEIGFAHGSKCPAMAIIPEEYADRLPFDLRHIKHVFWNALRDPDGTTVREQLRDRLRQTTWEIGIEHAISVCDRLKRECALKVDTDVIPPREAPLANYSIAYDKLTRDCRRLDTVYSARHKRPLFAWLLFLSSVPIVAIFSLVWWLLPPDKRAFDAVPTDRLFGEPNTADLVQIILATCVSLLINGWTVFAWSHVLPKARGVGIVMRIAISLAAAGIGTALWLYIATNAHPPPNLAQLAGPLIVLGSLIGASVTSGIGIMTSSVSVTVLRAITKAVRGGLMTGLVCLILGLIFEVVMHRNAGTEAQTAIRTSLLTAPCVAIWTFALRAPWLFVRASSDLAKI